MNILLSFLLVAVSFSLFGQKNKPAPLNLKNVLIIAQLDAQEDRYSLEVNMTELFGRSGITTLPSLNVLKSGGDASILSSDSMMQAVRAKGIDTYLLISIRGYDRKYRVSNARDDLETALSQASFFELYREGIVSISFQYKFFRNGECVRADIVKCGNVGGRDTVLRKLRKKVEKKIGKHWR